MPEHCFLQKGHGARRLVVLMPGRLEYLTRIRTFTVSFQLGIPSLLCTLSHTREIPDLTRNNLSVCSWPCLVVVFISFFPGFRWPRSSCRRSVSRWELVNSKRSRTLFSLLPGVTTKISASRNQHGASLFQQPLPQGASQLLLEIFLHPCWLLGGPC